MPNLDIEIESETVAPAAEQELSTDLSPDDVNTDGNLAAMQKAFGGHKYIIMCSTTHLFLSW